jgi:hypothetical protein
VFGGGCLGKLAQCRRSCALEPRSRTSRQRQRLEQTELFEDIPPLLEDSTVVSGKLAGAIQRIDLRLYIPNPSP